jgi:hypothetical protein
MPELSPQRAKRAGGLPFTDEANALVEIGGQIFRRRLWLRRRRTQQRLAGNQPAQQFGRRGTLRRLGRDNNGGESHGGSFLA